MKTLLLLLLMTLALPAQRWAETCGRTPAGVEALQQSIQDLRADSLVLLVAAHPDDRYLLPAAWLRATFGLRVAVLLATRGGGGQNSSGPETGDALERIRTLETEAGCWRLGIDAWYLNRTDGGYRRSAEEAYAEWGREQTVRDLARLLRTIRPDAVMTTHHREELHGHDLALVELLPAAIAVAADATSDVVGEPHRITAFLTGATSTNTAATVIVDADRLDPVRGQTFRRIAYDVLRLAHVSPGAPSPIDSIFEASLRLEPVFPTPITPGGVRPFGLGSVFDAAIWPGDPARREPLATWFEQGLARRIQGGEDVRPEIAAVARELRQMLTTGAVERDARSRLVRRIDSLERLLLLLSQVQIEVDVPPGTAAIAGEEFVASVQVHTGAPLRVGLRASGLNGIDVELEPPEASRTSTSGWSTPAIVRVPLTGEETGDVMARSFHGDRFVAPVRLRFFVGLPELEVPIDVTLPIERRAAVEVSLVPRMLLLPSARKAVQFSVGVQRNTQFPVEGDLEVRAPAGYAVARDRQRVSLRDQRSDLLSFEVEAPADRRPGVDVLRVRLGTTKVTLPVHKVDVVVPPSLRVGVLRSRDDTLPSVLGVGGLGVAWSELTDADLAVADLGTFDTIVVDIRALRDRPAARRGFRRLLDFAEGRGHRLVLFYQKDVEFQPSGEAFLGAPFPLQVGKARVTRADAPVRVLRPEHVLLRQPNVIRPGDWDGWEQERALYLPSLYAPQFEELLEIQDPGQPVERGALLHARTGQGEYVYCALALWRQLKKLHPGAVRLLANLVTPSTGS